MAQARTGEVLADRYVLVEELGAGGMGAVFRARDQLVGDDVALKVLLTDDPRAAERMRAEVRLARRVTHRNVARTFDLGVFDRRPFVTMELVEGRSLRDRLSGEHGLDRAAIVDLLAQIAEGLAAAHAADVVHRDLKPSNVMTTASTRAVLIDFGVAMAVGEGAASVSGTWDYMAPEQLREGTAAAPSDVFAFGVLAYQVLVGRLPYGGRTARDRGVARLTEPADVGRLSTLPPELSRVVAGCLEREPAARPPAARVGEGLRAWLGAPRRTTLDTLATATPSGEEPTVLRGVAGLPWLGVAPLAARGAPLARTLAASLGGHLGERLARVRGLYVAAPEVLSGTTQETVAAAAREAGIDLLVRGSLEVTSAASAAVDVELVDLETGNVLLDRRLDATLAELLNLGDDLASRVAEALRLELEVQPHRRSASPEAIALYLRARHDLRAPQAMMKTLVPDFERCLELAPGFVPAIRSLALAHARSYAYVTSEAQPGDPADLAIREAERVAPEAADTLIARAMWENAHGHLRAAIRGFQRALAVASTHPMALEQLGRIECETGRTRAGIEHLHLASALEPRASNCMALVARSYALRGQMEEFDATMRRMPLDDPRVFEPRRLLVRVADWYGRPDIVATVAARWPHDMINAVAMRMLHAVQAYMTGQGDEASLAAAEERMFGLPLPPRVRAVMHQLACEVRGRRSPEKAIAHLERAVDLPFFDLEWIELCPALDSLRDDERFIAAQQRIRDRARAAWA